MQAAATEAFPACTALLPEVPGITAISFTGGEVRAATGLSAAAAVVLLAETPAAVCLEGAPMLAATTTGALTAVWFCAGVREDTLACFAGGDTCTLLLRAGVADKEACFKGCAARASAVTGAAAAVLLCTDDRDASAETALTGCLVRDTALVSDGNAAAGSVARAVPLTSAGAAARGADACPRGAVAGKRCCPPGREGAEAEAPNLLRLVTSTERAPFCTACDDVVGRCEEARLIVERAGSAKLAGFTGAAAGLASKAAAERTAF